MSCVVDIVVEPENLFAVAPQANTIDACIRNACSAVIAFHHKAHHTVHTNCVYDISVLMCDDACIAALNQRFRNHNKPTNVLAWPSGVLTNAPQPPMRNAGNALLHGGLVFLGDIALSVPTCIREANRFHKPLHDYVCYMIVHACLHLLGFDHNTDRDTDVMQSTEKQILTTLGIAYPDIENPMQIHTLVS